MVVRTILGELDLTDTEKDSLTKWIYDFFKEVVDGEKALADDLYKGYAGINMEELHGYIEWRANILLQNLGLDKIFDSKSNPMIWINAYDSENINNTKTDFFEKRVTNYSKVTDSKNGWDEL